MAPTDEELEEIPSLDDTEEERTNRQWANRRKLAFGAFYGIFILTALILTPLIPVERIDKLQDVFTWYYITMSSVIGAYMGLSTFSHLGKK